jgi:hypothetical protein
MPNCGTSETTDRWSRLTTQVCSQRRIPSVSIRGFKTKAQQSQPRLRLRWNFALPHDKTFRVFPCLSVVPNPNATMRPSNRNRPLTRRRSHRHPPEDHPTKSICVDPCPSVVPTPKPSSRTQVCGSDGTSPSQPRTNPSMLICVHPWFQNPKPSSRSEVLRLRWNFALPPRQNPSVLIRVHRWF